MAEGEDFGMFIIHSIHVQIVKSIYSSLVRSMLFIIQYFFYDYGGQADEDRTEIFKELMKRTAEKVVEIGLTLGKNYSFKCPRCNGVSRISQYGGNPIEESVTCPKCERLIPNDMIMRGLDTRIYIEKNAEVQD